MIMGKINKNLNFIFRLLPLFALIALGALNKVEPKDDQFYAVNESNFDSVEIINEIKSRLAKNYPIRKVVDIIINPLSK